MCEGCEMMPGVGTYFHFVLVSDSSDFLQRVPAQDSVGVSVPGDFLVHLPLGPDSYWS